MLSVWVNLLTVSGFDDDEFKTEEDVGPRSVRIEAVIGVNAVEGDVAFSADLVIGAAWEFEVDGKRDRFHGFWG